MRRGWNTVSSERVAGTEGGTACGLGVTGPWEENERTRCLCVYFQGSSWLLWRKDYESGSRGLNEDAGAVDEEEGDGGSDKSGTTGERSGGNWDGC